MRWLLYLRLTILTAGTLLPFFWMVVILGHRRQRNFERVFFFLCLALTCFFGSSLLALNAQLFYAAPPAGLLRFAWTFLCLGLFLVPSLVIHLHGEYSSLRELIRTPSEKAIWLAVAWLPAVSLSPNLWGALHLRRDFDFERPTHTIGLVFQCWLAGSMIVGAVWQRRFESCAPDQEQKTFHRVMSGVLGVLATLLPFVFWGQRIYGGYGANGLDAVVLSLALVPFVVLILTVSRFNFLQMGRQRNLMYAVFGVFVALLYLSFVRRVGQWLEPYLPPEATAALLLFLPVVFFEPLQRMVRRMLRQTAQSEVDRAQKLIGPVNEVARLGDLEKLRKFAEEWIKEQLQLAQVELSFEAESDAGEFMETRRAGPEERLAIHRGSEQIGTLVARPYGAMISGETFAALELICEQLPASFDLCRLIEEKLRLERELAERERLALVGQMAASISHNLKNPLGSMKTILQVQLESPGLPESWRGETQMVLSEINRLSAKLNQLLQFSRPGTHVGGRRERCDVSQVAENVAAVFRHEAEQRGITLELQVEGQPEVRASAEATNDILSNLLLNALEATGSDGQVRLVVSASNGHCRSAVEDDGAGVPTELKERILQPFFTTKARGTGLGLAIVARRVEELGGELAVESPIREGRGSRFVVMLPLVAKEAK
jgi:signal transduction histidine kinase